MRESSDESARVGGRAGEELKIGQKAMGHSEQGTSVSLVR